MATGDYALTSWTTAAAMFGYLADEQAKVEKIIDIATARMEQYTGRKLLARDYVNLLIDGSDWVRLNMPEYPVNSIASIYVDSSRVFGVETLLPSTDYGIHTESGIIELYSGWFPSGAKTIKASFNAGYDQEHAYYALIESACLEFVHWMKTRWAGYIGKRSETNADGMNVGYEIDIPVNVRSMLDDIMRRDR